MTSYATLAARAVPVLLSVVLVGCKGAEEPAVATTVTAQATPQTNWPVGTAASPTPTVLVKDQHGNPMAGAAVTFTVTGGGTLAVPSATTDAAGIASPVSWTLGNLVGTNSLTATAGTLPPVSFSVATIAGVPTTITRTTQDNQLGTVAQPLTPAPSVRVEDRYGNPVPGAPVTFAVTAGGGSVTGGSTATNAAGLASVGSWTLGATAGTNTLTATVAGAGSVTFTATTTDPCTVLTPLSLGGTLNGALTTVDCRLNSFYYDFYSLVVPSATALRITQSGSFDTYIELLLQGKLVAENDDEDPGVLQNSILKALVLPATYVVGATSFDVNVTGTYSVTASTTSSNVAGCEEVWILRGVTTQQTLSSADCVDSDGPNYADAFFIRLEANVPVTFDMTSTVLNPLLILYNSNFDPVASNNDRATGVTDARLTVTPTVTGIYLIAAWAFGANESGAYTLSVSPSPTPPPSSLQLMTGRSLASLLGSAATPRAAGVRQKTVMAVSRDSAGARIRLPAMRKRDDR
jgi:hypothetical protein